VATDSSFDIVSKLDQQEVDNAINQAAREISQRFDFKNTGASISRSGDKAVAVSANADERALAVVDVFKEKLIKRGQSLKILDVGEPRSSGKEVKIDVSLREGISQEQAKKVSKLIRDEGPKGVKVQVQGEELRVSSKKRDDLQGVIALVKEQDYDFPVQFTNYR
jgi:cyclic-di-GMP-binding protein